MAVHGVRAATAVQVLESDTAAIVAKVNEKPRAARPISPISEVLGPADPESDYPAGSAPRSSIVSWQSLGLLGDSKGIPHPNLSNVSTVLQFHDYFRSKIWYDSFRRKVFQSFGDAPLEWTDTDARNATAWIQQHLQLPKVTLSTVQEAVKHAADANVRNSLTDWLDTLIWDGTERLDTWLFDCLGVERNPYNDAIARNWPISMVARAYKPGCQVDTMPVLEGKMGRGKSTFLAELANPWFAALPIAFGNKDFLDAIQGQWLIEIPDMSGFSKREHTQILATITTRVDVYRKVYGENTESRPRVTIFAATSETDDYLQDSRGRRRYWPLRCGDISLDALRGQREQIFAEAIVKFRHGASWYDMPDDADTEQLARSSGDLWAESVLSEAETQWEFQERSGSPANITSSRLLVQIGVKLPDQSDAEKKRVARIMREAGWYQSRTKDNRYWMKPRKPI
jgi:predicted P-loop ATPase